MGSVSLSCCWTERSVGWKEDEHRRWGNRGQLISSKRGGWPGVSSGARWMPAGTGHSGRQRSAVITRVPAHAVERRLLTDRAQVGAGTVFGLEDCFT